MSGNIAAALMMRARNSDPAFNPLAQFAPPQPQQPAPAGMAPPPAGMPPMPGGAPGGAPGGMPPQFSTDMLANMLLNQQSRTDSDAQRLSGGDRARPAGLLAGVIGHMAAAKARKSGDEKVADLYKQYFDAQNREAQAAQMTQGQAREQKLADEMRKREQTIADEQRQQEQEIGTYTAKKRIDSAYSGGLGPSQEDIFTREGKLRKEFTDSVKDYKKQDAAFGRVIASAEDPSPAGDLALIFNYMKILDPGSTVREGEFANAENSGSVPERLRGMYNSIIKGTRLSAPQRADFVDRAERLYDEATVGFDMARSEAAGLAEQYEGLDPTRVAPDRSGYRDWEPPPPPKSGDVVAGWTYVGDDESDPADPASWSKQ